MARKKILIADDSHVIHAIYEEFLGDGYDYVHSYDGADTLLVAANDVPDLIILDLMMPLLDGRSICKKLKSCAKTKHIKIVMVTARDTQSDRLVGFEVGADDYIEKPCPKELLASSVRKQLTPP